MRPAAFWAALESADFQRVKDALEVAEERLRDRDFDDDELASLVVRLEALSSHEMADVRRAVARVLRYLRHRTANALVQKLCADEDMQVAKAAERTRDLRSERAKIELLPEVLDARIQRELADLERRHPKARRAALLVGMKYAEFVVSALHHQVRNTGMPLELTLQILEKLTAGTPTEPHAHEARAQFEQVNQVMSNAREFVRIDLPGYERTSIRNVVLRALTDVRAHPLAQKNGLREIVEIDGALVFEAIESRLYEALLNLLKNAVEASEGKSFIPLWVSAKRSKGHVVVVVRDEGCGMGEAQYKRDIWRPYGSQKLRGTGLGMPIVKKIVVLEHNGHIDIESQKGVGTSITLTFPVEQAF